MATVTLHQVRTNEGPAGYKIVSTVTAATGMDKEIFVFNSASDEFDHVAVPLDFYWPITKDILKAYYRKDSCEKSFMDVNLALDFVAMIKNRVNVLTTQMTAEAATFPGDDTTNYPLPPTP